MVKVCRACGRKTAWLSETLPLCQSCLISSSQKAKEMAEEAHRAARSPYGLPYPTSSIGQFQCRICGNQCHLREGEKGFCGLREVQKGKIKHLAGLPSRGLLSWYYDPLPTNCVGDWVCPGGTGAGYPRYAYRSGPEYGYKNLAVFFGACSFSCLFCQNWHYKNLTHRLAPLYSYKELVGLVDRTTSCVCFFGGDPSPQMPFALRASREALEKFSGKILRICWETNGSFHPRFLNEIANVSIASGGCIKFDLKAFNENLHRALTGVSNKITLRNFESLAQYLGERPDPPFLIASTLLVPGYITPQEVRRIAQFLTRLDPTIPYSLLAFYPAFQFSDLPTTSRQMAEECLEAAKEAGLTRVHLGNVHLLT